MDCLNRLGSSVQVPLYQMLQPDQTCSWGAIQDTTTDGSLRIKTPSHPSTHN